MISGDEVSQIEKTVGILDRLDWIRLKFCVLEEAWVMDVGRVFLPLVEE